MYYGALGGPSYAARSRLPPQQVSTWAEAGTPGLTQHNWFTTYITSLGFVEAKSNTSLFIFWHDTDTVYLLLYVDDIVLTASNAALLQQTISALKRESP
jgi:hypothetical protein